MLIYYSNIFCNTITMARSLKPHEKAEAIWRNKKVECPVCNLTFDSWYCPNCGIPKNNSGYTIYEDKLYYCGSNHFRQDDYTHAEIKEYKLCIKCYTPNPQNARYCRNCCVDISSQARNKDGIGWVDLGLSVLWSADPLNSYYIWNNHNSIPNNNPFANVEYRMELSRKAEGKDPASYWHGKRWRTPTKEDFAITCYKNDNQMYVKKGNLYEPIGI